MDSSLQGVDLFNEPSLLLQDGSEFLLQLSSECAFLLEDRLQLVVFKLDGFLLFHQKHVATIRRRYFGGRDRVAASTSSFQLAALLFEPRFDFC